MKRITKNSSGNSIEKSNVLENLEIWKHILKVLQSIFCHWSSWNEKVLNNEYISDV